MAGTEDIANDDVEVPLYASPANVLKLLKVEQKRNKLDSQKNELQQQADSAISSLYKNILLYVAYTGGIIYFHTTELPSAIAFNVSILSMCLFMTGLFFHTSWAKSMITRRDGYIEFFAERHKRLRVDARILVELENNRRRRRLAANIADNSEGPLIDMASFMTRCKTIYDAADFYDFLKVYHKKINLSWVPAAKLKSSEDASQCDTSISTEQLEISLQPIVACGFQANQLNMLKEKRNNGSLLWPGLYAGGSSCSDKLGFSKQYPIAKFPAWFGSTGADAQAQNAESSLPTVKDSQVPLDLRKSFKRCAAHVYISRLIKVLQTAAREDIVSSHPPQSSSHDGSKQGTCLLQNCLTGKVNEMHGIVSTGSVACTSTEKNQTEVRNAILLHQRLLQEQQQASTTSGVNSLVRQNIDFLSLSAGSYVMKGANGANIAGHNLEAPLTSQDHPAMHFLLPQNGYSSTSFRFLPATASAQQVLLPPYLGGASTRPSFAADMTLQSQTLQQNELRNAHFTAQYKFGVSTSQTFSVWQNAGRQMPIFGPSQAQFAASSSMESLSSKLAPVFLSGQELMSISSPRHRGPYYLFPSGYEGNGHGLYPNKVPSLQLLCNGHL